MDQTFIQGLTLATVLLFRLIIPLTILRLPLIGGILSLFLDYLDFEVLNRFNPGVLTDYQPVDKLLDIYYLTLEAFAVRLWRDILSKNIAWGLFFFRLTGSLLYFLSRDQKVLFFFPNLFENFFLFYLIFWRIYEREPAFNKKILPLILLLLLIPKIYQEYYLHYVNIQPWDTPSVFLTKTVESINTVSDIIFSKAR